MASPESLSFDGFGQVIKAIADLMTLCARPLGSVEADPAVHGIARAPSARRSPRRSGNHGPPGPPADPRFRQRGAG